MSRQAILPEPGDGSEDSSQQPHGRGTAQSFHESSEDGEGVPCGGAGLELPGRIWTDRQSGWMKRKALQGGKTWGRPGRGSG